MNIFKLPGKCETINGNVVSTDKGWYFQAWNNFHPAVVFVNSNEANYKNNYQIRTNGPTNSFLIENQEDNSDICFIMSSGCIMSGGEFNKISPRSRYNQYYGNEQYYCFLKNPSDKDVDKQKNSMLDYTMALLSLCGLLDDYSYVITYHRESKRAVSFRSPLEGDLLNCSVSRDGLTLLMLTKNYAAVVDNPLL